MIRGAYHFTIFATAIIPSVFGQSVGGQAELAITLHQFLSPACELVQPATIHNNDKYASVALPEVKEDIYSPQLTKDDFLVLSPNASGNLTKIALKSGFRVKLNQNTEETAPHVVDRNGSGQCPSVPEAMQNTAKERFQRRQQIQSNVYRFGSEGVTPPVAIPLPAPDPSKANSEAALPSTSPTGTKFKYQGITLLALIVSTDGNVSQVKVVRSATINLDEKAIEVTKGYKFEPARKDGMPVPFLMYMELNFRLYKNPN
jgi:TonB family protein